MEAVLRKHLLPGELFVPTKAGVVLGHSLVLNTLLSTPLILQHSLFAVAWKPPKNSTWSFLYTRSLRQIRSLCYFMSFYKISLVIGTI